MSTQTSNEPLSIQALRANLEYASNLYHKAINEQQKAERLYWAALQDYKIEWRKQRDEALTNPSL